MVGQTFAHYEIVEKIGSGGMGDVYLANDTALDHKVALKVLPPELAKDEERRARFEREAKAISSLNHPNILTIHEIVRTEGKLLLVTEYVEGSTLRALIDSGSLTLQRTFELAIQAAEALTAAHAAGIANKKYPF